VDIRAIDGKVYAVDIHAINYHIVCFVCLRWATFVIFRLSVIEKSPIYHKELEIKETTETAFSSSLLDIQIWPCTNGQFSTRLYDKRDVFNFANINLDYGVYFSHLIRSILSFEFSPFTTLLYSKFQRKSEVRTKTKKHEQTDKEAVHIEYIKMILPFDCMDIHMYNKVKRQ
jgi:hypothetical protein